jgi:Gas vesicle protein
MSTPERYRAGLPAQGGGGSSLADILERVLDKGIVIAGDITINLLDIELLNIKLRLLIASVDKAREMGINWWESDAALTNGGDRGELEQRLARLEQATGVGEREGHPSGRG